MRVGAHDRAGLERLLRYCARPTFALERLELLGAERVVYRLAKPQRDGTTALTLSPLELIDQLAALIPPPRLHRHRYHGVLAPYSPLRAAAIAYGRAAADDPSARDEVAKASAAPAPNARSPARCLWVMLPAAAVRVAAAGLSQLRRGHAQHRLRHRCRARQADPHPHRCAAKSTPDLARPPLRCAVRLRLGTSPNHPGSVVRCFGAAHPPAWDEAPEPMPDWDLLQQPEPDFEPL